MKTKLYLAGCIILSAMNLSQAQNIERFDSAKRAVENLFSDGHGAKTGLEKEPVVQDGRQWSTRVGWAVSPPQLYTEIYRMEGDTVLDKKTYKKIYCYYTEDLSSGMLYHYAFRQDGEKVYLKFYGEKGETLFFDFSIKKGKSISVHGHKFVVEEVYDMVLSDGKTRKAIRLSDDEMTDTWVEGVGSLVYGINWDGLVLLLGAKRYDLLCCYQNGEQIYQTNLFGGRCFIGEAPAGLANNREKPNPASFWRLSPQPATEIVRAVCESTVSGTWHSGRWR
ncbi:MAG: hypothetical protein K2O01_03620, partial [Bacteroidales bacterium]|nr:hypothetical protein [Bacteroidales bacterium]